MEKGDQWFAIVKYQKVYKRALVNRASNLSFYQTLNKSNFLHSLHCKNIYKEFIYGHPSPSSLKYGCDKASEADKRSDGLQTNILRNKSLEY